MKWLSLDTDIFQDGKIKSLLQQHSSDGYLVYNNLLAQVASNIDLDNDRNGYLDIGNGKKPQAELAWDLHLDQEQIKKIIESLAELELIDPESWENNEIYIPKILERKQTKNFLSQQEGGRKGGSSKSKDNSKGKQGGFKGALSQPSRDKDKDKDKDKEKENNTTKDQSSESPKEKYNDLAPTTGRGLDYDKIKELWNSRVPEAIQIRKFTSKRKRLLRKRYKEDEFSLKEIIQAIQEQPFLLGESDKGWTADFTWIIESEDHYTNILERRYKDNKSSQDERILQDVMNDYQGGENHEQIGTN